MPRAWPANSSYPGDTSIRLGSPRVLALAAALCWAALMGGPLLVLRPNRLAAGEGLTTWEAVGLAGLTALTGIVLLPTLGALLARRWPVWLGRLASPALSAGPVLLLYLAGHGAERIAAVPYARVSLGWGFWGLLLGLGLSCAELLKRAGSRAWTIAGLFWLLATTWLLASGHLDSLSLVREFHMRQGRFMEELASHLAISGLSVAASIAVGIPLGLLLHRRRRLVPKAFFALNVAQTIPSLALFGLLLVPLSLLAERFPLLRELGVQGIGAAPALIALTLYALLPVVRNTFTALDAIEPAVVDAGLGMGMSQLQLLRLIKMPLALPSILGGIRVALVQNIGNTAVAALIGAGGLGVFIFQGLGQAAADLILLGALPTVLLALAADALMRMLIAVLSPGLARGGGS